MIGLLIDADLLGHRQALIGLLQAPARRELWEFLDCHLPTFEELDLPFESPDLLVWETAQRENLVLLTANRNESGPDSLGQVLRRLNGLDSLPVITLISPQRFQEDHAYANRAADRILEILFDLDKLKGAGRLWVP